MSPVDGLAPKGLHRPGHGPEGLLTGLRDHAAVSNGIVEITRATTASTTAMKAVPSPHGAPVCAMTATIMATRTAELAGMLVHLLLSVPSIIPSPPGRTGFLHLRHDRSRSHGYQDYFLSVCRFLVFTAHWRPPERRCALFSA